MNERQSVPESSRKFTLSGPKETALCALASGATITDAAAEAGVSRRSVSKWTNHDIQFQLALWQRRNEIWGELRTRVAEQAHPALDKLVDTLAYKGDWRARVAAAREILALTPLKHTDPPPPRRRQDAQRVTDPSDPVEATT